MAHAVQRAIPTRQDGRRGVLVAGSPLAFHALLQLAEGGGALIFDDKVVHASCQVVAGELDGDLNVSPFLLLLPRLRVEPVPPATEKNPFA